MRMVWVLWFDWLGCGEDDDDGDGVWIRLGFGEDDDGGVGGVDLVAWRFIGSGGVVLVVVVDWSWWRMRCGFINNNFHS
ncbi:hypothetical protein Ddye_012041 [Dipteronia dyeriana]|uniref:Transmembrane protein n=1 Tax=Dipteronia dyeriana TaxID=168575 RepID=A0AAD9X3L3_9ROSI|nr:hypothetical protein Ddye_012041 [Dipteronia dyeriana]